MTKSLRTLFIFGLTTLISFGQESPPTESPPKAEPEALGPGDHTRTLQGDGWQRSYLVHVPPQYDPKKPTPVVLVFHGGGSNAEQMVRFCGLNEKADQEGFIAVYPQGTGRFKRLLTWNGGNCCGYAQSNKVDDLAFTRALLDDLAKVANVDAKRIYATGMSNGAIMCYPMAVFLPLLGVTPGGLVATLLRHLLDVQFLPGVE